MEEESKPTLYDLIKRWRLTPADLRHYVHQSLENAHWVASLEEEMDALECAMDLLEICAKEE